MPARWGWSWVALPTDTPELLIGTYTLTTSDYRFAISGSTFFVESFRTNPNTTEISVELIELLVDGGGPEGHPEEERALVRDDSAPSSPRITIWSRSKSRSAADGLMRAGGAPPETRVENPEHRLESAGQKSVLLHSRGGLGCDPAVALDARTTTTWPVPLRSCRAGTTLE